MRVWHPNSLKQGFPGGSEVKIYLPSKFHPWVGKIPLEKEMDGKSHGQRSLSGYSPWCHKE